MGRLEIGWGATRHHNLHVINLADWIIDLGPGDGVHGGKLLFSGPVIDLVGRKESATGQALRQWQARGRS